MRAVHMAAGTGAKVLLRCIGGAAAQLTHPYTLSQAVTTQQSASGQRAFYLLIPALKDARLEGTDHMNADARRWVFDD